jgi:hypothetical protein
MGNIIPFIWKKDAVLIQYGQVDDLSSQFPPGFSAVTHYYNHTIVVPRAG